MDSIVQKFQNLKHKKFLDKSKLYIFISFEKSIFYKFINITNKLVRKANRNSDIFIEKLVSKNYKPANNTVITKQNLAGPISAAGIK